MALDSRFVYPRSIVRDVAATIDSVRHLIFTDHIPSLDLFTRELVDTLAQHDPHIDADDFCRRAGYLGDSPVPGPTRQGRYTSHE